MGNKHYPVQMFSDGMDDFVDKTVKTSGMAGLQSVAMTTMPRDFSIVASKLSPFIKNASRQGEHWQEHSEKDCS
jgi:hypothetical protein